ncbi:protein kinase domain-containing protein [Nonomuraea bangladeshensis]|uniref:serine/threonine-protein kinase n=1 Tax=Nonomuraea bangladeshensis TaxID=404385 RepID=UPI003C2B97DC
MRLRNRYLLVSRIAMGGMGEVWRARDELLGREVAVKILRSHIHVDPAFRERFRNEARITASLADPGIAQVFDYGEQSDLAYLVMELVHGEPLSAILARNGAIGAEVTLDVVHQTARALHTAHAAGVIHRDVKPGNLLVTPEGVIKVTDFGIARALEAAPVTQTGTVLGTAQYVSPEQAQGFPLTPSTDLYSLGVVAYECLAGRTPFLGDNHVAIALRHLNEAPRPLGVDVPAPVRELVMRLLAKDPGLRPGTAMEVADRAYMLREALAAAAERPAELSMLTDPGGFRVREPSPEDEQETDLVTTTASDETAPDEHATGPGRAPARRRRRGARTLAVVATAGCVAAVGLSAMTLAARTPGTTATPGTAEPTPPVPSPAQVRPGRTKPRTHRPPVVPVRSSRPTPSRSATVSKSATPTRKPTPKPTPTTRTPTPTPTTPKPTTTLTTPTPPASPDQGATNTPEEET